MTIFEGVFKPPIIGLKTNPIKIAGLGNCEVKSDGLQIKGFKQIPRFSSFQFAILFFVLCSIGKLIGGILGWLMLISGVGLLYLALKGQGTDHTSEEISLLIPWNDISQVRFNENLETIIIQIKEIQHQTKSYKGALFFHPSIKTTKLLDLLRSHHVDCESNAETTVAIFIGLFILELILIFIFLGQGSYFSAFLIALATIFRFTWPEIGINSSLVKIPVLRNSLARWVLYLFLVSMAAMISWEHVKSHGTKPSPSDHGGSQIRRKRGRRR